MSIYYREVLPLAAELRLRYPKAKLAFHGFIGPSDIKVVSDEMAKLVTEVGT